MSDEGDLGGFGGSISFGGFGSFGGAGDSSGSGDPGNSGGSGDPGSSGDPGGSGGSGDSDDSGDSGDSGGSIFCECCVPAPAPASGDDDAAPGAAPLDLRRHPGGDANSSSMPPADSSVCSPPVARGAQNSNALAPPAHDRYPDLPKTTSTVGQFTLESKAYDLTVGGDIKYVKGWIQFLIQLGGTVPATTGGGGLVNWGAAPAVGQPPTFSGSDWRYAQAATDTVAGDKCSASGYWFWDGTKWQDVPVSWSDPTATLLYPIGIWQEGTTSKAQMTNTWPGTIPAWGTTEETLRGSVLPRWTNTIQTDWSHVWDLKRQDCPSFDQGCCRYHPNIVVSFNEIAKVSGRTIVLAGNNARSNSGAWSMGDNRPNLPAHEFGHHLGYPDEYTGGVGVDASVNEDGAVNGIDADSMMGQNMTIVKKRHFKFIGQQLALMMDTKSQRSNGYVIKAVPTT